MRKYDKMYPNTGGTWQGIINKRLEVLREKAAEQFLFSNNDLTAADRFRHLAICAHYRHRMRILTLKPRELRDHKASWRYHLHCARYQCPRPRLP